MNRRFERFNLGLISIWSKWPDQIGTVTGQTGWSDLVFKTLQKNPRQWGRQPEREEVLLLFFLVLLFFLSVFYFFIVYRLWERVFPYCVSILGSFIYIYMYVYCIHILELFLEVWIVKIDLGLYSGKLFLPHLFICIMFLFFLGFLRFILFYIYYICDHFVIWIFYPFLLFNSLPIWVIYSLYSTFCMYAHLPKFFYSSICLSFLLIILLICFGMCYYTYCILFKVFYICIILS